MTRHSYERYVLLFGEPLPDWRWRRAVQLATAHHPPTGRYTDDDLTLAAARVIRRDPDPSLDEVRAACEVHRAGGLRVRVLQAYLLTYLTAAEAAVRVGLSEPVVTVFGELFFAVRGSSPLATLLRAEAGWADDRLWRMAAAGVAAVHAAALWEAGGDGLSPEWAERFERADLLDRLFEANPAAYIRAVDRLRAIEERFRPTVRRC